MGTAVKPEPIPVPNGGTPSSPAPAATPPTPSPAPVATPAPSTNKDELERMRSLMASQESLIREQAREVQRLRGVATAPPPAPPKDPKDFFAKPHEETRAIVKEELATTIAPLQDLLQRLVSKDVTTDALAKYRTQYPQFNWDKMSPTMNVLVEQARNRGVNVDSGVMDMLALSAMGLAASGQIPDALAAAPAAAPAPSPAAQLPVPVITPPHMQPSAPPIPAPQPTGAAPRSLTENEERLRRERGWTTEQFLSWLEVDPSQVVNHKMPGEK